MNDFTIALRGFLMGAADIVPGVSGGTVALIVGVYERLLAAISHFDGTFLGYLTQGRWRAAAEHVDLRFLIALGGGIGCGVVGLAGLMHHLLEHHQSLTFAAFFGLILASGVLVGRMCRPANARDRGLAVVIGLVAAAVAVAIVSLPQSSGEGGLGYTFFCGAIAICAMILPGVSGSYLLVLLGMYEPITGLIKRLPRGQVDASDLLTLVVFAAGCAVGLAAFSRVLKWLLARCWTPTMAALCGFMIGSLWKVWPFQEVVGETHGEHLELKERMASMVPVLPETLDTHVWSCLGMAVGATAFVLIADALARRIGAGGRIDHPIEAGEANG